MHRRPLPLICRRRPPAARGEPVHSNGLLGEFGASDWLSMAWGKAGRGTGFLFVLPGPSAGEVGRSANPAVRQVASKAPEVDFWPSVSGLVREAKPLLALWKLHSSASSTAIALAGMTPYALPFSVRRDRQRAQCVIRTFALRSRARGRPRPKSFSRLLAARRLGVGQSFDSAPSATTTCLKAASRHLLELDALSLKNPLYRYDRGPPGIICRLLDIDVSTSA